MNTGPGAKHFGSVEVHFLYSKGFTICVVNEWGRGVSRESLLFLYGSHPSPAKYASSVNSTEKYYDLNVVLDFYQISWQLHLYN